MSDAEQNKLNKGAPGDSKAVEALLQKHLPGLHQFVRRRAGRLILSMEDSSDLVQSTCREILSDLPRFEFRGEHAFKKWLYATALHKIVDRARYYHASKREQPSTGPAAGRQAAPEALDSLTPSRHVIGREEKGRLESMLTTLSADHRTIIQLARIQGLPHREIARRMDRSEGAVRVLLSRALARLATLLDDEPRSDHPQ